MSKFLEIAVEKLKSGKFLKLRKCSICESALGYEMHDDLIFFDPYCDCMKFRVSSPRLVLLEELAEFVNQEYYQNLWGLEDK